MASGAAKRYAQAVFSLAQERGTLEAWHRDLLVLHELMSGPRAPQYFSSPNVRPDEKVLVLDQALAGAQPEARNLARLLVERGRLDVVPDLFRIFNEARLEALGIAVADVTTADPLSEREQAVIRERLKQLVGKDVELRLHTDPGIIGGIVARVGDLLIDGSVITRLRRLRQRLIEAEVTA
jgi:F-type H+-transporting ATPase subunit delta